ncbi:hypothetical protein ATCC90586_002337 [Pythium insidiosum]|nr:hypothetical protein ATCC90586_002337 [Pythium insidiosum]
MSPQDKAVDEPHHFIEVETPNAIGDSFAIEAPQLTLEWRNLNLQVKVKNSKTKDVDTKRILSDVSGTARPGELLVIMGPSGAGKSSLLDCIAGRNVEVQGTIALNGAPWSKRMKRFSAYVMQDDLFYETITVREHLLFQARLRMGGKFSPAQYTKRVDTVIEELGLSKCRDTYIGGAMLRGISGGERKRLSFATEILTNPSLLFVDEPTSGLDSYMAETVVMQLQQLARDGRTVIATIHQPSSELFTLFDKLYLLADGATVYSGNASDAVEYFAKMGLQCPSFVNPTDFFMRQLVVLDVEKDEVGAKRVQMLKDEWAKTAAQNDREVSSIRENNMSVSPVSADDDTEDYEDARLGSVGQLAVLMQRNVLRLVRDRIAFQAAVFQTIFIAIIVGLIYLQLDLDQKGVQNFAGAFFFIVVNQTFASASPLFVAIPTELPMIIREYRGGLYQLFIWFISKNSSELPLQLVLTVLFFLPAYLLIGIGKGVGTYLAMQLMIFLLNFAAVGLGYMVSCISRRVEIAPIIGIIILLPFMLFGGLFLNTDDAPSYFIWIQYISPIKYAFEGFMKIFWTKVDSLPCDDNKPCLARNGDGVLEYYSMNGSTSSIVKDGIVLLALGLAFRLVGFLALWLHVRPKRTNRPSST